jgi:hypothetical protein
MESVEQSRTSLIVQRRALVRLPRVRQVVVVVVVVVTVAAAAAV